MRRHLSTTPDQQPDPFTLAAGTWLASGIVLLGLTPLPMHDAQWGWSPAFWLLLAPALVLYAIRLLSQQQRKHATSTVRNGHRPMARRRSIGSGIAAPTSGRGADRRRTERYVRHTG